MHTTQPVQQQEKPTLSFSQAYAQAPQDQSAQTRGRGTSQSQLAEIFNDGQSKAAIMGMLSATPQYSYPYQQPYQMQPQPGVFGMAYGYGQPAPYGMYGQQPMAAPHGNLTNSGGFSFVSANNNQAKKDPFDFGDLSKLASNM